MKDWSYSLLLILLLAACSSQVKFIEVDTARTGVAYKHVHGTVFSASYSSELLYLQGMDSAKRWTPTKEDIQTAEKILKDQIKEANKTRENQGRGCPVIQRHLNAYFRQYVGLLNDRGQKLIHINMTWVSHTLNDLMLGRGKRKVNYASDFSVGTELCSYHWQIDVNLDEKKLSGLNINKW